MNAGDRAGADGGGYGGNNNPAAAPAADESLGPDIAEEENLLTAFLQRHTVLTRPPRAAAAANANDNDDSSSSDDDSTLEEPGTDGLRRTNAYRPYLACLKARQYDSTRGTPVLQIPLDEIVSWDSIAGRDLANRIVGNTKRYVDVMCRCVDNVLDSMPAEAVDAPAATAAAGRGVRRVRDSIDILQEQRVQQHERAAAAARRAAGGAGDVDVNGPLGGGGLANDPNNDANNNNNEGPAGMTNAIPPTLLRRYELRILPRGRRPCNGTLGLNFPVGPILASSSSSSSTRSTSVPPNNNMAAENDGGVALRRVRSHSIGCLVSIRGMVVRTTDVKPACRVATYVCDACGAEIYQEIAGREFLPHRVCPVEGCHGTGGGGGGGGGGSLFLQTRGSKFVKFQELKLQELPDQVPVGHVPRCMPVHCYDGLTRQCTPGDVVTVDGIFLPMRGAEQSGAGYAAMRAGLLTTTYLEAMNVTVHKKHYDDDKNVVDLTQLHALQNQVVAVAHGDDPVGQLSRSIAPEIFGHEDVKRALLLQLVGGCERTLPDGMRIRGDINVCLMGDPGVAKSQLLKYIASVAPRGVYTTGRGSSGVGLTAAVTKDVTTGDLALEGGALVLADKGICCIDEFDKMDEMDRTAIHEVMEQQTVSIAKAGIVATLNARAAVLAAANPLWGRYNRYKSLSENINLPNSLLSRFDLMFLILDVADADRDMALARHVTFVHRHNGVISSTNGSSADSNYNPNEAAGEGSAEGRRRSRSSQDADIMDDGTTGTSGDSKSGGDKSAEDDDEAAGGGRPLDPKVVREYISTARQFSPVVSTDVAPYIVEAYVGLRMQDQNGAGAGAGTSGNGRTTSNHANNGDQTVMTARQLLSILRLSQALARLRFSDFVAREDVDEAIRLTHMSKASLLDQDNNTNGGGSGGGGGGARGSRSEDVTSRIFHVIRDYATASRQRRLELRMCEAMVLRKGFTAEQLRRCLEEYEALNIIQVNATGTHVDFVGQNS